MDGVKRVVLPLPDRDLSPARAERALLRRRHAFSALWLFEPSLLGCFGRDLGRIGRSGCGGSAAWWTDIRADRWEI